MLDPVPAAAPAAEWVPDGAGEQQQQPLLCIKRTYQPHPRRHKRKHGFLKRCVIIQQQQHKNLALHYKRRMQTLLLTLPCKGHMATAVNAPAVSSRAVTLRMMANCC
jgi:hypothetical protein